MNIQLTSALRLCISNDQTTEKKMPQTRRVSIDIQRASALKAVDVHPLAKIVTYPAISSTKAAAAAAAAQLRRTFLSPSSKRTILNTSTARRRGSSDRRDLFRIESVF